MAGTGRFVFAAAAGCLALAFAIDASAGVPGKSLASELIQARTQQRILKDDDAADTSCHQRHFTDAHVVRQPERHGEGKIAETKWQEQWTLNRCGKAVGYRVFFTEVGLGGAYFSVVQHD